MTMIRKSGCVSKATPFAIAAIIVVMGQGPQGNAETHADDTRVNRAAGAHGQLPIAFERNSGQTDDRVEFLARGKGYTLFLAKNAEAVLSLRAGRSATALIMRPVGARVGTSGHGLSELPGKVNYLAGADRSQWRSGIPTYGKVQYAGVYPGIDLVYYGNRRQIEYAFIVTPGADPDDIVLEFEGADHLAINREGHLVATLGEREITQPPPTIYQDVDGIRQEVGGRYILIGRTRVGFQLERYRRDRTLIIDPTLVYSTYLEATTQDMPSRDVGTAVAICSHGDVYLTGETDAIDFPTTAGAFDTVWNGDVDAVVAQLNADGTALVYATYLGGSSFDRGTGIAVDAAGHAYVTGYTRSADFPVTAAAFDASANGAEDAFVAKLDPSGAALVYSTYLGGSSADFAQHIALDPKGNAYITGNISSVDFPATADALDASSNGLTDAFVTKLGADGTLAYSTYLGGTGSDFGAAIAVDWYGSAYVTGSTASTDFPTTPNRFRASVPNDAFVTKLDPSGTRLQYSLYLGGSQSDSGRAIAVDVAGNAYVAGLTRSADFPVTLGAFDMTHNISADAFVTKLNASGTRLVYSTFLGGTRHDEALAIAVDLWGSAYITGATDSSGFPTTMGAFDTTFNSTSVLRDAFVTKVHPAGLILEYSTFLGGNSEDTGNGIAVDAAGSAYVVGSTASTTFPTTDGVVGPTSKGGSDIFVTKLDRLGWTLRYSTHLGGTFSGAGASASGLER